MGKLNSVTGSCEELHQPPRPPGSWGSGGGVLEVWYGTPGHGGRCCGRIDNGTAGRGHHVGSAETKWGDAGRKVESRVQSYRVENGAKSCQKTRTKPGEGQPDRCGKREKKMKNTSLETQA